MVFPARRKVIFVHGCFWHSHNCKTAHVPKSNPDYWRPKLERNHTRDMKNLDALGAAGWQCLIVWECEVKDCDAVGKGIRAFLNETQC
jgi:DNA mismatch endonuclease (patch repair protein)